MADASAAPVSAADIVVESLLEDAGLRSRCAARTSSAASCGTRRGEKAKSFSQFENYLAYQEPVRSCSSPPE